MYIEAHLKSNDVLRNKNTKVGDLIKNIKNTKEIKNILYNIESAVQELLKLGQGDGIKLETEDGNMILIDTDNIKYIVLHNYTSYLAELAELKKRYGVI
jgi:hypothetical protein